MSHICCLKVVINGCVIARKDLKMRRDKNGDDNWPELKAVAKQQKTRLGHKPLDNLNVQRNNLDEDADDLHKIKKNRADKHLRNVENMLQSMTKNYNKSL